MALRIGLVQPRTEVGDGARERNLQLAQRFVGEAAEQRADIVCFPETFPGAWREPVSWTPVGDLAAMAREHRVHVVGGYAEPMEAAGRRCFNTLSLFGPTGEELGRYRRTVPNHAPWIYRGGPYWDFDWVPDDELPVFRTDLGTIGLLICSEVYGPEVCRALALKGAEIVLMPAGLAGPHSNLLETWRTLVWARSIENLMVTAVTSNVVGSRTEGFAMVCTPEAIVLETGAPGLHVVEVDLERIRWLRDQEDRWVDGTKPWRTKPGVLRDWRRPAVTAGDPALGPTPSGD